MTQLNEFDSKISLESVGIPIPKGYFIPIHHNNLEDIVEDIAYHAAGIFIGESAVIKIISPNVIHKSEAGGVILNVAIEDLFDAVNQVIKNVTKYKPDAKIDGIYIEEMIPAGIECIIGIKEDPQFGKVIMFGMGGIYAEIFKDISMRVLPISIDDAYEMITETKIYKILSGARGKVYDIKAIIDTLIAVSLLADNKNIKELDINPLVVHEHGVKALDARILL